MAREAEVFDLGYQHYTGPREGRNRARIALFVNGVRTLLGIGRGGRAKIMPALLFLASMAPAVVFVVVLVTLSDVVPGAEDAADQFIPGPGDYYSIVGLVLIVFAAIMAPELLVPDRRENVFPLYMVRPLTATDYIVGRCLAFFAVSLVLAFAGQAVLQLGLILTADNIVDYARDNWLDVPRIVLVGAAIALFATIASLAVSAFTTRRAYASVIVIGFYLLSVTVVEGLTTEFCSFESTEVRENGRTTTTFTTTEECSTPTGRWAPYIGLLSMSAVIDNINSIVFDVDEEFASPEQEARDELNDAWPIGVYALFTGLPALVLWNRYRRMRL
ncbi:MAG: hypothetical protein OYI31_09185 [Chloroflexota bacterium]|nr:hypothetical protein [Chloroflexota bacterium]MDE2941957.1 hypothetical protein [Chloroflexota bacterium]MDE3268606.1 hypothetical protein [Chloroflexota bacterium]